jgi:AcrR family transcriptional regulator
MTVDLAGKIVDSALELAEQSSWEAVRLNDIAAALGIDLNDIRSHFREKEEIVEAWFDRADRAMLEAAKAADFSALDARQRLYRLILAWLSALSVHKRVTREMICNKFEPGHLHVQIPGVLRVSRTVQWLREAAGCDATFARRAIEELGLTGVYLLTFAVWLRDDSAGVQRSARFLEQRLREAERLLHWVYADRTPKPAKPAE